MSTSWHAKLQSTERVQIRAQVCEALFNLLLGSAFDVLGLIKGWCGLSKALELLELQLQLARFASDGSKRHDSIECQPNIFTQSQTLHTVACPYALQPTCVRQGINRQQGHFRTLFLAGNGQPVHITDDGANGLRLSALVLLCENTESTPMAGHIIACLVTFANHWTALSKCSLCVRVRMCLHVSVCVRM